MSRAFYTVKKIFGPTLQGEGSLTGCKTVFVRFAGCNAWDGRPETKASSLCPYCDTDFRGGERMTVDEIVAAVRERAAPGMVVTLSGGEPLLQVDVALVRALRDGGWRVAVETNGTQAIDEELRAMLHVTCSPKVPRDAMALADCDDLKVLVPHPDARITPDAFADFPAKQRWVQPVNGDAELDPRNVDEAVSAALRLDGDWRVSVQLHKILKVE